MIRGLPFIPLALLAVPAGGAILCAVMGWDLHPRELTTALISSAAVSALALVPIVVARNATQASVAQAALISTLIHLLGHASVAAAVILLRLPLHGSFIWWLMPFYWATLIALAAMLVKQIRHTPVGGSTATGSTALHNS